MKSRNSTAGKVNIMRAQDMFKENSVQLFNLKTGEWIKTINRGNEFNFDQPQEPEPEEVKEPVNPNQIKLF